MSKIRLIRPFAEQQRLVREAMMSANPDEEGSLMRELDKRGVGDLVRKLQQSIFSK